MTTTRRAKYIIIPVQSSRPWVRSKLTGKPMPQFDEFKMLRSDYDKVMKQGGAALLGEWILNQRKGTT